jgi:phosphatidylethanolamine-binding protein (PEBP) family uncharacterized protein
MAPRTSAQRLIKAAKAKGARAGIIPALALAALLALPGCGGGGGDGQSQSASTQASTAAQPQSGGQGGKAQGASSDGEGKQGPAVKPPKGPAESEPTPSQRSQSTLANIALSSPALKAGKEGELALPATYTCDGKDTWPQFSWHGVPSEAQELALFALNIQPVKGKLFIDWALAGLDPSLEEIGSGEMPEGAVLGKNSAGESAYSICPPKGSGETYLFTLYAVPSSLSPSKGFDARALREEILEASGNAGLIAARYERG